MWTFSILATWLMSGALAGDVKDYAAHCESCHGPFGAGNGPQAAEVGVPVPDLGDAAFWTDREPARTVKAATKGSKAVGGSDAMPGQKKNLSPERIAAVDAFVRTFPTLRAESDPAKGAAVYADNCHQCHGDAGAGDGPMAGSVGQKVADLRDPAVWAKTSEYDLVLRIRFGNPEHMGVMPEHGTVLTYQQLYDLVQYLDTTFRPH